MLEEHLKKSARDIYREKLREIFEDETVLVDAKGFRLSQSKLVHIN